MPYWLKGIAAKERRCVAEPDRARIVAAIDRMAEIPLVGPARWISFRGGTYRRAMLPRPCSHGAYLNAARQATQLGPFSPVRVLR